MNYIKINGILVKVIAAFYLVLFLVSCSGNYVIRESIDKTKNNLVFIENFSGDRFNIKQRLEFEFAKMGFNPTLDKGKSDFILKWQYTHAAFGTNASVRLVNKNGKTVYLGEGDNPGFGTLFNKTGTTWGCFERALEGLGLTGN